MDNDPTTIYWSFNTDGTLNTQTKEDGTVLTYGYDALRRVTSISVGGVVQQEFSHDSTGRQIWSRDYNRLTGEDPITVDAAKVFDSLGRVVEESLTVGAGDAGCFSDF